MDLPLWARLGVGVGVAAALAYLTTPVAIATARRFAFYDVPTGYKGHRSPTPYLGGTAVMLAFGLAALIGAPRPGRTLSLLAGVVVLWAVGTVDDRRTVRWWLRVAIELALGVLLARAGLGWKLGSGPVLDAVVTAFWVVAVVNAFNLFDNMDGAASTMALVVAAGACVLAIVTGHRWVAVGSAALCGACVGFLPYNLSSPAKIFLGDGGSMPLGFVVAALVATAAQFAEPTALGLLLGFLLVGIPALDTCLVIVSRRRRGLSVLTGGQDHLTHRTRARLRTARRVVLVLGSAQALVSVLVILASRQSSVTLVYIVLAFIVCAATAIVALEAGPMTNPLGVRAAAGIEQARAVARRDQGHWGVAAVAVLGLGAGISPLFSAYYDLGVWIPIAFVVIVLAAALTIARPPQLTRPVVLTLSGLAGIGLSSLLSTGWAQDVEQATVQANLWLAYGAFLLLAIVLLRRRRQSEALLAAIGAGIALVAAIVLVRMLGSDPAALFLGGRLNLPLGYVNGEGCVFAMGCWLSLSVAERREPWLAGLGAAATVALASLTLLSQSRGAAIATFVALLVVLLAVPGARRRLLALAVIGGGFAAAASHVLRVYSTGQTVVQTSVAHRAAIAILLASVAAGLVWAAIVAIGQAASSRRGREAGLQRIATAAAAAVVLVPVAVGLVRLPSIEHTAKTQWHAFVHLSDNATAASGSQSRLFSGAGNRYDYWRVAWHVFVAHPLAGVGAGNYPAYYFRERHTTESIQNPHSIELQTLSELGLIGAGLLALVAIGVAIGVRRFRVAALQRASARTTMVAATGMAVAWAVDTSGDWMHLLPGVTAMALAAIAVLCVGADPEVDGMRRTTVLAGRFPAMIGAGVAAFALAVGGASLVRAGLARHYLDQARADLASRPAAAIVAANRSLRLDSANLDPYYVKAAGYARFDYVAAARATLLQATREDPEAFVTWALLGDLEVRAGDLHAARIYYGRAHRLDPNDRSLAALAADPRSALPGA